MTDSIKDLQDELVILVDKFTKEIDNNTSISRYSTITNNPVFLLIAIALSTFGLVIILNIFLPIPGGYLDVANLLLLMILATVIWIPINTVVAWRMNQIQKNLLQETPILEKLDALIEVENLQYKEQLSDYSLTIDKPSKNSLIDLIISDGNRGIFGPRNSKYQIDSPFPVLIEDTDDFYELSGRLLLFSANFEESAPVDRIFLQGQSECLHKSIIFLSKEKQYRNSITLIPSFSPILAKIRSITKLASKTTKFALNITKNNVTLVIHDYRSVSTAYLAEIMAVVKLLRTDLPKLFLEMK